MPHSAARKSIVSLGMSIRSIDMQAADISGHRVERGHGRRCAEIGHIVERTREIGLSGIKRLEQPPGRAPPVAAVFEVLVIEPQWCEAAAVGHYVLGGEIGPPRSCP